MQEVGNSEVHATVFFPPCFLPSSSTMHFYYFFLLLLVVLSAYSESPHLAKPPDSLDPIGCPNSSSAQLGVLAPVLPQNEVYRIALPQNEVYEFVLPQSRVFKIVLP